MVDVAESVKAGGGDDEFSFFGVDGGKGVVGGVAEGGLGYGLEEG